MKGIILVLTVSALAFGALLAVSMVGLSVDGGRDGIALAAPEDKGGGTAQDKGGGGYELVAPLGSVMGVMEEVFSKMPDKVKSGTKRDFKALLREAQFVAEIGNLTGRLKEKSGSKEWVDLAAKMTTSSLAKADAAKAGDAEGFKKAYEQVKTSCGSCHEKFRD